MNKFLVVVLLFLVFVFNLPLQATQLYKLDNNTVQLNSPTEEFFNQPFGYTLSVENLMNAIRGIKVSAEPFDNHFDKSRKDTLYSLTFRRSTINIYNAGEKYLLVNANIKNRRIKMYQGIHTGMRKAALGQIFPQLPALNDDKITLYDEEGNTTYHFHFNKREKLKAIEITTNFD